VLDVLGGLATIGLSLLLVQLLGGRSRSVRALVQRRRAAREAPPVGGRDSAYRLSQSCYEVQEQVD
jgi:hypothetical protein